jgi:hypothetical protein
MSESKNDSPIDAFHEHLTQCDRCQNSPFDLCDVGYKLLVHAALPGGIE